MVIIRPWYKYEHFDIFKSKVINQMLFILYSKELECEDTKNSTLCKKQKNRGKCSKQKVWMKCRKTCEKCGNGKKIFIWIHDEDQP